MRTVSDTFLAAILGSYTLATEAAIIDGETGDETIVPIVGGTVTLDQTTAVRGRCDVTLSDDGTLGLVPTDSTAALAPYGNEIRLSRGITYADGTTELVGLGVFRIQDVEVSDAADGLQIKIAGLDRTQRIIDARFEAPYQIASGTNTGGAILATVQAAWPDVPESIAGTSYVTPSVTIAQEQDDRWQLVSDMATSIARRLYFDGDGTLVLNPTVLTAAVATLAEGTSGVLLSAGRRWTREGTFNRVIATGENTGEAAAVRGVATDENPFSPTYYFGPFGRVPRFYRSQFLTTDAQAAAAAQSILDDELGTTEQVNFGSLVLPHLEPGDTVRITRARSGIDEDHVIDSITIPLSAEASMTGQTRARQVIA